MLGFWYLIPDPLILYAQRIKIMRTRYQNIRKDLVSFTEHEYDEINKSEIQTAQGTNVPGAEWTADLMIDEVVPQFKTRRGQGSCFMNPCSRWKSIVRSTTTPKSYDLKCYNDQNVLTQWVRGYVKGQYSAQSRLPRTPTALLDEVTRNSVLASTGSGYVPLKDAALVRALNKATSSDALGLVTLAEIDKTIDLYKSLGRLVGRAAGLLESLGPSGVEKLKRILAQVQARGYLRKGGKKRLIKDAGSQLAFLASTWLGYRYGIMATAYDIMSWADGCSASGNRVRFTAQQVDSYSLDGGWQLQNANHFREYFTRSVKTRSTTVRAGVLIQKEGLSRGSRLGFDRLASTCWELVPFSFVLDWVLNVGDKLSAMEGNFLVQPLGSWVSCEHTIFFSTSYDYRYNRSGYAGPGGRWYTSGFHSGTCSEELVHIQRIANPRLSPLPQVHITMNPSRWADAISLLATNTRRIKRHL